MTYTFKLSRRLAGMRAAVLVGALTACASDGAGRGLTLPDEPSTPTIASLQVTPATDTMTAGNSRAFLAVPRDAGGRPVSGAAVTWGSSDAAVASASADGAVTARAAGLAYIVATAGGARDSAVLRVTAAPDEPAALRGWFVAADGASSGDGTIGRPWNLATALAGAGGRIVPGDTVWLRGGTYTGTWRSTVSGASDRYVVFRQFPGERATLDARGAAGTATTLTVEGVYTAFWGFEITNTDPDRSVSFAGNAGRAHGIYNKASHTRYINLVVHDAGVALYSSPATFDVEVAGGLFYNNGWSGPDRGHGHAIYLRSNTGPVTARDNVMFGQFGYGVHAYTNPGEGYLNNIRIEGNVAFNNGTVATNSTAANILVGGDDRATGDVIVGNFTYMSAGVAGNNVEAGYGSLVNGTVTVRDNTMVGGSPVLEVGFWTSATISGNTLVGGGTLIRLNDANLSRYTVSGSRSFTGSLTPLATEVFVRPNPYEAGRAHLVVYNWAGGGSVAVNLAGIVPLTARYEIRNVQNPFGAPVASGTYAGGAVTVPVAAVTPPAPIGWSRRAPSTGTLFHAYIVTVQR